MWEKLLRHKLFVATAAGVSVFLAYPRYQLVPFILVFPFFLSLLTRLCKGFWSGFLYGFFTSFIIMVGGFYWVIYVIHEFGYLPWFVAVLMFLGFCGFGALNFPVYVALATEIKRRLSFEKLKSPWPELWYTLGFPALFTIVEYLIPKLFPWYVGHSLFRCYWLTQIAEITGCTFLTFALFSLGSSFALAAERVLDKKPAPARWMWLIPGIIWIVCIAFSAVRLSEPLPEKKMVVALVQANIGSLEKVAAERGIIGKVRHVADTYKRLTQLAVDSKPRPQLIVWPETAMPFQLENELSPWVKELRASVLDWKIPLITGGYALSPFNFTRDYNAAFLFEPTGGTEIHRELYQKNILLAFGEYMPFGEWFPVLYKWFPEVSNFDRGRTQNAFTFSDGTRFGVTICYEAIVPSFFRKVVANEVNAVVNLTNDSWFGPTAEPYLHGAITIFRAIESRVPLIRVTNTGTSFTVDMQGRISEMTGVYEEAVLKSEVRIPKEMPLTFYTRFGDWFIIVAFAILAALLGVYFRKHASLSI